MQIPTKILVRMRWKLTAKFNTRSTNRKCCTPQSHPNLCINTDECQQGGRNIPKKAADTKKDKKINAENQCIQTQGHSSGFCLIWILYILKYKRPYFFMNHM